MSLEVVVPHLERDGAAGESVLAKALGDCAGHPVDLLREQLAVGDVVLEGVLDAHRLGLPLGDDRAVVLGAGQPPERGAGGGPEEADELVLAGRAEVLDGVDADATESFGRGRSDAGDGGGLHRAEDVALRCRARRRRHRRAC